MFGKNSSGIGGFSGDLGGKLKIHNQMAYTALQERFPFYATTQCSWSACAIARKASFGQV
jgi:hypothetical protein